MTQDANYWINRPINDEEHDWKIKASNWLEGYTLSVQHPHRQLIIDGLKNLEPISSVLEVGCNTGPNLLRIQEIYPKVALAGIDVNQKSLEFAQQNIPKAIFKLAHYRSIPFANQSFDVVLADATLLYAGPDEIFDVLSEINRVAKRGVILVERYAPSLGGEVVGHVWGRDYKCFMIGFGWDVKVKKLTRKTWPKSINWQRYGRMYLCQK